MLSVLLASRPYSIPLCEIISTINISSSISISGPIVSVKLNSIVSPDSISLVIDSGKIIDTPAMSGGIWIFNVILSVIFPWFVIFTTIDVEFSNKATVCKYAVPAGYPENPVKDAPIYVSDADGALVFYSSVYEKDGVVYTTGSRAAAVVGVADTIMEAEQIAEKALSNIGGPVECRHDIGKQELSQKRIDHMKSLRGEK